jgi:hypothetical protein
MDRTEHSLFLVFAFAFALFLDPKFRAFTFKTGRAGQEELDWQNKTRKTGLPGQDCQDRKPGQDSQERIAGTGQLEQDCHDTTSRTRRPVQVFTNRAATTGLLGSDRDKRGRRTRKGQPEPLFLIWIWIRLDRDLFTGS